MKTYKEIKTFKEENQISSVIFHPNENILAFSNNRIIKIINIQ